MAEPLKLISTLGDTLYLDSDLTEELLLQPVVADVNGLELILNGDLTETDSTSEDIILLEAVAAPGGAVPYEYYYNLAGGSSCV